MTGQRRVREAGFFQELANVYRRRFRNRVAVEIAKSDIRAGLALAKFASEVPSSLPFSRCRAVSDAHHAFMVAAKSTKKLASISVIDALWIARYLSKLHYVLARLDCF